MINNSLTARLFILFLLLSPISILANAEDYDWSILTTYEEDITGDSQSEKISLYGIPLAKQSPYYHNIMTTITTTSGEKLQLHYPGGYEPTLSFIDFNHDQVADIFYQSSIEGKDEYQFKLHTLKANKMTEIPLPKQHFVQGNFLDNFKVEIQISPDIAPAVVNIKNEATDYIRLGIYNQDGKLRGSTSPIIHPITKYEPVFISDSKGYGLKSEQAISGTKNGEKLGTVKTLWYFENNKWIILHTDWLKKQ